MYILAVVTATDRAELAVWAYKEKLMVAIHFMHSCEIVGELDDHLIIAPM